MNGINSKKIATYQSLVGEIRKAENRETYHEVALVLPPETQVTELWRVESNGDVEIRFDSVQFPLSDIDDKIKRAYDRLRYLREKRDEK